MQKPNQLLHRIRRIFVLALLLVLTTAATACAIDPIDHARPTSLIVIAQYEKKPLPGMTFDLYLVAEMGNFGSFVLGSEYSGISSDGLLPDDMSADEWNDLAQTLAGYAEKKTAPFSGKTDAHGRLTFAHRDMRAGLYLLVGKPLTFDNVLYDTKPTLIALPGRDADDQWLYHQVIYPKPEKPKDLYVDLEVVKVWKDSSYASRPKSVTVELLLNGRVIDTKVLSAQNNWKHCWKNQPYDCKVAERPVGDSYTVRICRSGNRFVITNSRPGPKQSRPSTLPQTGQLWWPVPLLAGAGMALFIVGWLRRRNDEEE